MSRNVIASVIANGLVARQMVGNVSKTKDGMVSVEYKEPGQIKTSKKVFQADKVIYRVGEGTGFVIAPSNAPLATFVGTLGTDKNGATTVESAEGTVVVNAFDGAQIVYAEADEDSKEARAAERAGKVKSKVRSSADKEEKSAKKSKKSKGGKKSRDEDDEEESPKKKKKKKSRG